MKIRYILLVFVVILGLLFINYLVLPEYQVYQELSSIPSIEKWPTHTDSRLGLSFQYPPSWEVVIGKSQKDDPVDFYELSITEKKYLGNNQILVESTNDKVFRDVQIGSLKNGEKVTINGLDFIQVKDEYGLESTFYYLEGKAPIRFQLYNFYTQDEPSYHPYSSKKMYEILNEIIHTMQYVK